MKFGGVEWDIMQTSCGIDNVQTIRVNIRRNYNRKVLKVTRMLERDILSINHNIYSWVKIADLWCSCLCAVLADGRFGEEELAAQVFWCDDRTVDDCDGFYACEDQVLDYFCCEAAEVDEEDGGIADLFLGLDAPKADLTVVERDLVW